MLTLRLSPSMWSQVQQVADRRYELFKGHDKPHYEDSPNSHLVGAAGEGACEELFRQLGLDLCFRWRIENSDRKHCDMDPLGVRLEVKTWTEKWWDEGYGPAIAATQWEKLWAPPKKCQAVVWCTADNQFRTNQLVTIRGWSIEADFHGIEPVETSCGRHRVWNYCLPRERIRPLEALVRRVALRLGPAPSAAPAPQGRA